MTDAAEHRYRDRLAVLEDRLDRLARRIDRVEELVDGMTKAEEIANAVTSAIHADRRRRFTLPRRLAGATAALILLVPALHDLTAWIG